MNRNVKFNTSQGLYYFDNSVLNCAHIVDNFFSMMLPIFENTHVCTEWGFEDEEIIFELSDRSKFFNMGLIINQALLDNLCEEWENALSEYDRKGRVSVSGSYENDSFYVVVSFNNEEYEIELNQDFSLSDFYNKIGIEM